MTWQNIVVGLIVAASAAWVVWRVIRKKRPDDCGGGCTSGCCTGCPVAECGKRK